MIQASPAFKRDGLLVINFDESGGPQSDSTACCGEGPGLNALLPGLTGLGGAGPAPCCSHRSSPRAR